MKLSTRERAFVLFAMRNTQQEIQDVPANEMDYGEHAEGLPLSDDEIDELCERINTED